MAKICLPVQGLWVQGLVGEIRSHVLQSSKVCVRQQVSPWDTAGVRAPPCTAAKDPHEGNKSRCSNIKKYIILFKGVNLKTEKWTWKQVFLLILQMRTQPGWPLDTSLWGGIWHVVVSCQFCVLLHKHGPKVSFREITASLVYFFILAALCGMRDLSSLTRLNPRTLHWKWGVLTTGLPRKSPSMFIDCYEMEGLHLISTRTSWRGSLGSDLKVTTEQKKRRSMSKPHIACVPGLLYTPFYCQLSWTLLDKLSSSERVQLVVFGGHVTCAPFSASPTRGSEASFELPTTV